MGSWSGYTRALSEPVRRWVTSGSGISQREDTELIEVNQESGTDVVRKGEEDNGTLHSSSMSASTQTGTLAQLGVSPRTRRLSWLAKNVSYALKRQRAHRGKVDIEGN